MGHTNLIKSVLPSTITQRSSLSNITSIWLAGKSSSITVILSINMFAMFVIKYEDRVKVSRGQWKEGPMSKF